MVPFEFWYTLIWVLVELGQGLLIEISITWDDIEDLEKTATKPGTVKIGNYIDEKNIYFERNKSWSGRRKNLRNKRHLFSLLQFFRIILTFFWIRLFFKNALPHYLTQSYTGYYLHASIN